jgi:hypothetical protein
VNQQTGKFGGLSRSYILMNLGTANGSLPELNLQPVAWYDPKTCGVAENIKLLIDQAEASLRETSGKGPEIVRAGVGALRALQGMEPGGRPNGK